MGLKRPFDAEEMQKCNAKHARQLSFSLKQQLNQLDQTIPIPYHVSMEKTGVLVEDLSGHSEKTHAEKAPFSWNSTDLCQEDSGCRSFLSDQSSGSDFSRRPISPVEDVYSCLINHPPRKQVPVGSNHQANIPEYVKGEIDLEGELMGKCVMPMPDSDVCGTGQGRKECLCLDKGSVRCVRQHIMESRQSLIESIDYDRFMELGFCEIGEEVANLWTEAEEDLFHKVVYSNPVSLDRDFWKQLKMAFPSRTMKELVSYYFNVFILMRRATQNRFETLDVDSDDDEWQVEYKAFFCGKSLDEEEEEETKSNEDEDDESPIKDAHCVYRDKVSRDGEVNVEDDSCMSFELQDSNLISSNREYSFDDERLQSDCWTENSDLLPTSNILDEIFGQDEWGDNDDDNLKGK